VISILFNKIHIILIFSLFILSYPLQVLFDTLLISKLFYIWIAFLSVYLFVYYHFLNKEYKLNYDKFYLLVSSYLFIILWGSFQEYFYTKDILDLIRLLLLYFFPVVFFFYLVKNDKLNGNLIINIIIGLTLLLSIEILNEFSNYSEPTLYQKMNFKYVENLLGEVPRHLLDNLRDFGLMSHHHVTALFIGFGLLTTTAIYIKTKNNFLLLFLFIISMSFIAVGGRLSIFSVFVFLIFFVFKTISYNKIAWLKIFLIYVLSFIILFIISYKFTQFWITVYFQYLPDSIVTFFYPISEISNSFTDQIEQSMRYASNNDSIYLMKNALPSYDFIPSQANVESTTKYLFGIGFGSYGAYLDIMNDNLFVLQLYYQLGVVGSIIFLSILVVTFKRANNLINSSSESKTMIWISIAFIFMMSMSFLHSGVFTKKGMYAYMFFFIFLINRYYNRYIHENTN